ncbi:MAG: hypothetical protein ACLGHP_05955, partial [Vicinamibacteria bacterium]
MSYRLLSLVLLSLVAAGCGGAERRPPPDLILTGGTVYTLDPARPWADALAVTGERISAVGS